MVPKREMKWVEHITHLHFQMIHKPVILGIAYSPATVYALGELWEVAWAEYMQPYFGNDAHVTVWHTALSSLFRSPGPPNIPVSGRYDYSSFPHGRLKLRVVTGLCVVGLGPESSLS